MSKMTEESRPVVKLTSSFLGHRQLNLTRPHQLWFYTHMMLMFSHSALWKHFRVQTTIIHVINVVRAKGRV